MAATVSRPVVVVVVAAAANVAACVHELVV